MKRAKAMTAILLVLAFGVAIFAGCSEERGQAAGEISDFESQTFFPIGDNSQTETESESSFNAGESAGGTSGGNGTISGAETQTGGFRVSEKSTILREITSSF